MHRSGRRRGRSRPSASCSSMAGAPSCRTRLPPMRPRQHCRWPSLPFRLTSRFPAVAVWRQWSAPGRRRGGHCRRYPERKGRWRCRPISSLFGVGPGLPVRRLPLPANSPIKEPRRLSPAFWRPVRQPPSAPGRRCCSPVRRYDRAAACARPLRCGGARADRFLTRGRRARGSARYSRACAVRVHRRARFLMRATGRLARRSTSSTPRPRLA